ncbi:MAG TPA: amino acid ABC transporter permease [Phototrophicaceae bacterium]|nr:amino acid ABC transporter permease [Phototrophicaceae bacterium]
MSNLLHQDNLFYVAPTEPPPSRRPPALTIGLVGWLRTNLFSSRTNSVITLVMAILLGWVLVSVLAWALRDAEWTVVTANLRLLMVGQYAPEHLWRVGLLALVVLFLGGISVSLWAKVTRSLLLTLIVVVLLLVIIPVGSAQLPPPSIRFVVPPDKPVAPMLFTGDAGQVVTIQVEPITNAAAQAETPVFVGFIENTGGLSNSRSIWNDVKTQVVKGALDLSQSDLRLTVNLVDARGAVLGSTTSTPETSGEPLTVTLAAAGWYTVLTERDATSRAGYAWVRLDGVTTFTTQMGEEAARIEKYGPLPTTVCPTAADCRQVAERDLRFEGSRSLSTYLTVQLVPFFNAIVVPFIAGIAMAGVGSWLGYKAKRWNSDWAKIVSRLVVMAWILLLPISWFMLRGFTGSETFPEIATATWGGLLLTLVLTAVAIIFSFPLGVLLALGRWSQMGVVSIVSSIFIEVVRGVPLITILFFAKLVVPFFISASADIDQVIRMMIGLTLFTAAYIAEIVRGGLQIVSHGQIEAGAALGLSSLQSTRLIVLPQALRAIIPALMSQFVSLFKDTTLVSIVGLFELLGIIDFIVNGQQRYRGLQREAYLFVGLIYFIISFTMSTVSRWVEQTGVGAARR